MRLHTLIPEAWPAALRRRHVASTLAVTGLLALSGAQGPLAWRIQYTAGPDGPAVVVSPDHPAGVWLVVRDGSQPAGSAGATAALPQGGAAGGTAATTALTASGIPAGAYSAYQQAAKNLATSDPSCHLDWSVLAGIGRVESNHGRFGGSSINSRGIVTPPIIGIRLDGSRPGTSRISDSDNGRYDGDRTADRAVGPMQFLPGTWRIYGGGADPQNMAAAALAAGRYLCAGDSSLATQAGRWSAVYRYNHSDSYVSLVLSLADSYRTGDPVTLPGRPGGTTTNDRDEPATPPGAPPAVPVLPPAPPPVPPVTPSPSISVSITPVPSGSTNPTSVPTSGPTSVPTSGPTSVPTSGPTSVPTSVPVTPTTSPPGTPDPTGSTTVAPSKTPTVKPTKTPAKTPAATSSPAPTRTPAATTTP